MVKKYYGLKYLVVDPSQVTSRSPDPEAVDKQRLVLLEEVAPNKFRVTKADDFEILQIDFDADAQSVQAAKRIKRPADGLAGGRALVLRTVENSQGAEVQTREALSVKLARVYDDVKLAATIAPYKDAIAESPDLGFMLKASFDGLRHIGFEKPLIFLPNENNVLSRVHLVQTRGAHRPKWDPRSEAEVALTSLVMDNSILTYDNRETKPEDIGLSSQHMESVFGGNHPFYLNSIPLGEGQNGILAVVAPEGLTNVKIRALIDLSEKMSHHYHRIMHQDASGVMYLPNKEAYSRYANELISDALTDGKPVSTMMIDVDHLKALNSNYLHEAGSRCLNAMGFIISRELAILNRRSADDASNPRWRAFSWSGTDEIVIVGKANKEDAIQVAKIIRQTIEMRKTELEDNLTPSERLLVEQMDLVDAERGLTTTIDRAKRQSEWFRTVTIGVANYPKDLKISRDIVPGEEPTADDVDRLRGGLRLMADGFMEELKGQNKRNHVGSKQEIAVD